MVAKPKRKPGPRPRGPFEGKRRTLTTKITEGTRTRIEDAAKASDRSLSQEIELRLERSLLTDDHLQTAFGGAKMAHLIRAVSEARFLIEASSGVSIWRDFEAYMAFKTAIQNVLLHTAPKPSKEYEKRMEKHGRLASERKRKQPDLFATELEKAEFESLPPLPLSPIMSAQIKGEVVADAILKLRVQALNNAFEARVAAKQAEEQEHGEEISSPDPG